MSIVFNGSSQYISTNSGVITAYPGTVFIWGKPTALAVAYYVFDISNNTSATLNAHRLRFAGDSSNTIRLTVGDGSTNAAGSTLTSYSAGVWSRATEVLTSATSRDPYLNNGGSSNNSNNITPTGLSKTYIGVLNLNLALSGFFSGELAYAAIWSVALGAVDRARLEAGESPFNVQRANLRTFVRMDSADSGVEDLTKNFTWTATGSPTWGVSPGLIKGWP